MWKNKATILSFLPHLFWVGVFFCIGYQQRTQYQPIFRETDKSLIASGRVLDSINPKNYVDLGESFIKKRKLGKQLNKGIEAINHRTEAMLQYLKQEEQIFANKTIFWDNQKTKEINDKIDQFYEDILTIYEQTMADSVVIKEQKLSPNYLKELKFRAENRLKEYSFLFEKENEELDSPYRRKKINTEYLNQGHFFTVLAFELRNRRNSLNQNLLGYSYIGCNLMGNRFFPVIGATKGYCKIGEEHKMMVACGYYAFNYYDIQKEKPVILTVNNIPLSFKDYYIGRYSEPTTITGKHTLHLKAQIYNPIKDKYESAESTFEYTVAEKPLTIRTPLQTVLYKGIQQPIYFRGLDETIQKVSSTGGKITAKKGDYFITPYAEDSLEVVLETKEETRIFVFKVKPLPYPTATLSNKISDGTVSIAAFQELSRQPLGLIFKDLEEKPTATILHFTLTKVSGSSDIIETLNTGNKLCAAARNFVQTAKKGDIFVYENITAKVEGEATERVLAPLIFKVE